MGRRRRLGLGNGRSSRRALVGVGLAGQRRALYVIGGGRERCVVRWSGWGRRGRRRWGERDGGDGRRGFGGAAGGRRGLIQFLCQSSGRRRRPPSKGGFGNHRRGFREQRRGGVAVIGLSVCSGFELLRPGGRGRPVPHLRRWKEGEGWFGRSGRRSWGLGCCWCGDLARQLRATETTITLITEEFPKPAKTNKANKIKRDPM